MYSTVPTGSLVTLGGHLRVVLHSDDATASVSADPRCHWGTDTSSRRSQRERASPIDRFPRDLGRRRDPRFSLHAILMTSERAYTRTRRSGHRVAA